MSYGFDQFPKHTQVALVKDEFYRIAADIFNDPVGINNYAGIVKEHAKMILASINKMNSYKCICCRSFRLPTNVPIPIELDPLIDIAQKNARQRRY